MRYRKRYWKKTVATLLFLLLISKVGAQAPEEAIQHLESDNDLYKELLQHPTTEETQQKMEEVEERPNEYIPPVLYAYSNALFRQEKKEEALFWFYLAQLRTQLDVNLGKDDLHNYRQKVAMLYNRKFTPPMEAYARQNIPKLKGIVEEVVRFMEENEEGYDHGWIYADGGKTVYKAEEIEKLTKNRSEFPIIKKQTIQEFYNNMLNLIAPGEEKD